MVGPCTGVAGIGNKDSGIIERIVFQRVQAGSNSHNRVRGGRGFRLLPRLRFPFRHDISMVGDIKVPHRNCEGVADRQLPQIRKLLPDHAYGGGVQVILPGQHSSLSNMELLFYVRDCRHILCPAQLHTVLIFRSEQHGVPRPVQRRGGPINLLSRRDGIEKQLFPI